ncbi:MAG: efflux RND transporter permease subunit [Pseudomonadota bacterium]
MGALTNFALSRSTFTTLVMIVILAVGVSSYLQLPKRENPEITIRTAVVIAEFDGMAPGRVEDLIAIPLERKIREIADVDTIETVITTGRVMLYPALRDEASASDIEASWEDLRNKMNDIAPELPEGTVGPMVNTNYGDVSIATIAVTGDGFSMAEIEDAAETLRRQLSPLDGIAKITLYGVQDERIWLDLDTRKLASVGVQLDQLLNDLAAQNVILPAGEIDADGTRVVLEADGDLSSVDAIESVLTKVSGLSGYVRLSDLVDVRRGYVEPKETPAYFNGEPAVILAVEMTPDTDIQVLGETLKAEVPKLQALQPIGISYNFSTFQDENVTASINNALQNVGQTFVVVLLVMLVFLGLRAAVAIACIVPFTVAIALLAMSALGIAVEQVSIAAVIISLGLLVDNGLVVVEDIEGRVKAGEDKRAAARAAGSQFAIPLAVASITTVSAFLPMLLVPGTEGEFSYSLGMVVAAMLIGSWLTALYILPLICVWILRVSGDAKPKPPWLARAYGGVVRRTMRFGILVIPLVYGAVAFSATQFSRVPAEMFPLSERADLIVYMDMPKGTAISETERQALAVDAWFSDENINPEVSDTTIYVGEGGPRFYLSLDPAKPDEASAFLLINTHDGAGAEAMVERARRVLPAEQPAARYRITRLSQGGAESGIVEVEIRGPDGDVLLEASRNVEAAFAELPNIVQNETDWGNKVLKVIVDIAQDKAREFGVTSRDISELMDAYFSGTAYSTFREGDEQIPIALRASQGSRDSLEDLANLSIAANGQLVSIDQVASFRPILEYSSIRREDQVRQIITSGKSTSLSAAETLERITPTLNALNLGPEYSISIGGEIADSEEVYAKIGGNLPLALGVMLVALVFQFNSFTRTLVTIGTIPIILIGAPYALLFAGQPMSFFAVLGLMSLMGIIINNAIVLINQIDIEREIMPFDDALVTAAQKRAKPIMLTSLTTIFGLMPMALSGGALFEPMATIMIGGLLFASPITLFFVPCACYLLMKPRGRKTEEIAATT